MRSPDVFTKISPKPLFFCGSEPVPCSARSGLWRVSMFSLASSGLGIERKGGRAFQWEPPPPPVCFHALIGRLLCPSTTGALWLAAGGGSAGDGPLIEARGGEKVINLHPSTSEIISTVWQTRTSPREQMSLMTRAGKASAAAQRTRRLWAADPRARAYPWCRSLRAPVFDPEPPPAAG